MSQAFNQRFGLAPKRFAARPQVNGRARAVVRAREAGLGIKT